MRLLLTRLPRTPRTAAAQLACVKSALPRTASADTNAADSPHLLYLHQRSAHPSSASGLLSSPNSSCCPAVLLSAAAAVIVPPYPRGGEPAGSCPSSLLWFRIPASSGPSVSDATLTLPRDPRASAAAAAPAARRESAAAAGRVRSRSTKARLNLFDLRRWASAHPNLVRCRSRCWFCRCFLASASPLLLMLLLPGVRPRFIRTAPTSELFFGAGTGGWLGLSLAEQVSTGRGRKEQTKQMASPLENAVFLREKTARIALSGGAGVPPPKP